MSESHSRSQNVPLERDHKPSLLVRFAKCSVDERFSWSDSSRGRPIRASGIHRFPDDYYVAVVDSEQSYIVSAPVLLACTNHLELALGHFIVESNFVRLSKT